MTNEQSVITKPEPTVQNRPKVMAAVDLGSNSFHMVVARFEEGHLTLLDRLREMVRLADGLDDDDVLSEEVQQRALECLSRFGERLRSFDPKDVAVVGTNTLRRANKSGDFLKNAESLLGHPIEIISGREEARLVYLGVSHSIPPSNRRRLVVDIGGGSTELVVGKKFEAERMYSLFIGCVSVSKKFFQGGKISKSAVKRARLAVDLEISPVIEPLRSLEWNKAFGSSGTIRTISKIALERDPTSRGITRDLLNDLVDDALKFSHADEIDWLANYEKRRPVFMGGLIVLERVFEAFNLKSMSPADYALREGLLYDLLGHGSKEDARERSVKLLVKKYDVDRVQADRLSRISIEIFRQVKKSWGLPSGQCKRLLNWSARLHEIGLAIAHSHYHRHGAYVVANADLPGFSQPAQQRIAWMIEGHRRRIPQLPEMPDNSPWHQHLPRLLAIFRIGEVLVRARKTGDLPNVEAQVTDNSLHLILQKGWLRSHPLTRAGFNDEVGKLQEMGIEFSFE